MEIRDRRALEWSSKVTDGETICIAKWIGHQDNNVAEYVAFLEALQHAVEAKAKTLHVFSDSEVMVKQMTGEYACRSNRLHSFNWTCRKLARAVEFSIAYIPREQNRRSQRAGQPGGKVAQCRQASHRLGNG